MRPVHEREPFLRFQLDRLESRRAQRGAGVPPSLLPSLVLPHQRQRQMGQGGQVPGRAHAPLRGHTRVHAGIQHRDNQLGKDGTHPARPPHQHVRPQQHHRPHAVEGERIAYARGVTADQVALQLADALGGDAHVRQLAEPGGDPVDRGAAGERGLDNLPAPPDLAQRARGDRHRRPVARHRHDVRDRQRPPVDGDRTRHTGRK